MYNEKWITNRWRRFYEGESESYSPEVHYSSTTKYRLLSTMDAWIFFVDGRFHNECQWLVRNQSFLFQSNSLRILQRELCQADRLVQSRQTPQRKGFFNWTTRMSRFIKDAGFVFSYWVCLFFFTRLLRIRRSGRAFSRHPYLFDISDNNQQSNRTSFSASSRVVSDAGKFSERLDAAAVSRSRPAETDILIYFFGVYVCMCVCVKWGRVTRSTHGRTSIRISSTFAAVACSSLSLDSLWPTEPTEPTAVVLENWWRRDGNFSSPRLWPTSFVMDDATRSLLLVLRLHSMQRKREKVGNNLSGCVANVQSKQPAQHLQPQKGREKKVNWRKDRLVILLSEIR